MEKKECSKCKIEKPLSSYHKRGNTFRGVCSPCREIKNEQIDIPDLDGEEWLPVREFEECYLVSNKGRIKSLAREIILKNGVKINKNSYLLKQRIDKYGYPKVNLKSQKLNKLVLISRLVAIAFIPNPSNLPQVNHKSMIKTDNNVENLEWCSGAQNQRHRYENSETKTNLLGVHKAGKNMFISNFIVDNMIYTLGKSSTPEKLHELYLKTVKEYEEEGKLPEMYVKKRFKLTNEIFETPEEIILKTKLFLDANSTT